MDVASWVLDLKDPEHKKIGRALEMGKVLYAPSLPFELKGAERDLLSDALLALGTKNISYYPKSDKTKGVQGSTSDQKRVHHLLKRFSEEAHGLVAHTLPAYKNKLVPEGYGQFAPLAPAYFRTYDG